MKQASREYLSRLKPVSDENGCANQISAFVLTLQQTDISAEFSDKCPAPLSVTVQR